MCQRIQLNICAEGKRVIAVVKCHQHSPVCTPCVKLVLHKVNTHKVKDAWHNCRA